MRELAEQVLKDAQDFNFNDEIIAELNEGIYSINDELADR
jgi:predicted DNA-binding protein